MRSNGLYDVQAIIESRDKNNRKVFTHAFVINSNTKDTMVRGKKFYGVWNWKTNMWETDMNVAMELFDEAGYEYVRNKVGDALMNDPDYAPIYKRIVDTNNGLSKKFRNFFEVDMEDHWHPLNQKVMFSNSETKKEDYISYKLSYPLQEGPITYYKKLMERLYLPDEIRKIEWLIGALLAGEQGKIQKFFVFFGDPGTGKSTVIDKIIVETLLGGYGSPYTAKFTADALINGRDSFGTDFLSSDPIFAYDDDADLSRVNAKTTLNMIVSHERIRVNAKFARVVWMNPKCFLVCGTNEPVQLSQRSGFMRRLIDIRPTGETLSVDEYDECINQLQFEKSGIAWHCLEVYKKLGKNYYNHYIPEDMLSRTDPFHNYVKDNYPELCKGITLASAYNLYEHYCEVSNLKTTMARYKFRDNLKLYFEDYGDYTDENGKVTERFFSGFKKEKIGIKEESKPVEVVTEAKTGWLSFDLDHSDFDNAFADMPAQYAKEDGSPKTIWANVTTKLRDVDTRKLHWVKVPEDVIVIDFDIKDDNGEKSYEKNLAAANMFPPTYAELSKSGSGIHLHYIWTGGDPDELSRVYGSNIEIKVYKGNAALRRQLTKCNDYPIAELSSGLPKKGAKKTMVDWEGFKNEQILTSMIIKNLNKEYHQFTKPSVDYIYKLLNDAYRSGASYDVRKLHDRVLKFALSSHNKKAYCAELVSRMHFCSDDVLEREKRKEDAPNVESEEYKNAPIVIFDIEIFPEDEDGPAFFLICWKFLGKDKPIVVMLNPKPEDVSRLFDYRLVGFNNRSYDNHMIYAAAQGYSGMELYRLSKSIIERHEGYFSSAWNLSWADVYDFATKKQGLKKWEIDLDIHHQEAGIPWDKSVPLDRYNDIVEYCKNDVLATEAVFNECQGDLQARMALAELSGLTVNDPNRKHIIKILCGNDKKPTLVYTDFATGEQYEGR